MNFESADLLRLWMELPDAPRWISGGRAQKSELKAATRQQDAGTDDGGATQLHGSRLLGQIAVAYSFTERLESGDYLWIGMGGGE